MNDSQNKNYEFDVEKYTIPELFNILRLNDKSKENISEHMENMIITYSNNIKNNESNESKNHHTRFIHFLKQARKKILKYLNYSEVDYSESNTDYNIIRDQFNILEIGVNNEPVQLKPTNYEIIHSKSIVDGSQHNITKNKIVPVVYTNDWKYPAGVINPIEKRFITKIINIDSLFRENYATTLSSNFMWVLPENLNNVISMKITSIEIPYSWFVISEKAKNNKFTINLFNISGQSDITHTITIPDGNYMAETFVVYLTNYFQNIGNGLQFLYATVNVDNTKTIIRARINTDVGGFPSPYDPTDSLYSPNFYFTIDFISEYETNFGKNFKKSLGWFLGFRKPLYTVTKDNTFNDNISNSYNQIVYTCYLSSESSYGSSIQNYFFLDINDYNNNEITDSIVSSIDNAKNEYIGNNIIAKIPIVNPFFTTLFNNNANDNIFKQRDYLGPVRLNKLHIRLLNKFGDIIDLNGNDFSFTLEMSVLYQ
jgi:hypothetical protein